MSINVMQWQSWLQLNTRKARCYMTSKQQVKKGTIIKGRARDKESETKNTVPMFAISFRNGHAAFFIFVPNTALNPELHNSQLF